MLSLNLDSEKSYFRGKSEIKEIKNLIDENKVIILTVSCEF